MKPLPYKLKTKWKIDVYLIPFPTALTLYLSLSLSLSNPACLLARRPRSAENFSVILLFILEKDKVEHFIM